MVHILIVWIFIDIRDNMTCLFRFVSIFATGNKKLTPVKCCFPIGGVEKVLCIVKVYSCSSWWRAKNYLFSQRHFARKVWFICKFLGFVVMYCAGAECDISQILWSVTGWNVIFPNKYMVRFFFRRLIFSSDNVAESVSFCGLVVFV